MDALVAVMSATTDWISAVSAGVAAVATGAATVGAWIAVKISLDTARQAESDRAIEAQERADRRRDLRQDQARRVILSAVSKAGYTGTRGTWTETSALVSVDNQSEDPIFGVVLTLEARPAEAIDPGDPFGKTRAAFVACLPPKTPLDLRGLVRISWPEHVESTPTAEWLPSLAFTDVHGVRWSRGADYVLVEVAAGSSTSH